MPSTADNATRRKERGAFFTPLPIAEFIARWAITTSRDRLLEPACGDAVFLEAAAKHLDTSPESTAEFVGFDIHEASVRDANARAEELGVHASIRQADFFSIDPSPTFDGVIGNPPFIRFQGFAGEGRRRSLERALAAGVNLSGLASAWAAFVVHASQFLRQGGRLAMVLPAELLSVNYAGPVRSFLMQRFAAVDLVVFEKLQFDGIQADVVLLLASGYNEGGTDHFTVKQVANVGDLATTDALRWSPESPGGKWTGALVSESVERDLAALANVGAISQLANWGQVSSGAVSGRNAFFTMSGDKVRELDIPAHELVRIIPPGTSIARVSDFSRRRWEAARDAQHRAFLLVPGAAPSSESAVYLQEGERQGVPDGYKCRVRETWWRTPGLSRPDLLVSYMSGHFPRIVVNGSGVAHLNGIHGLKLSDSSLRAATTALPVLALSSASLLSAEIVGRTYGGGVLKLEPTEARRWTTASPSLAKSAIRDHTLPLRKALAAMHEGDFVTARTFSDMILRDVARSDFGLSVDTEALREARDEHAARRVQRSKGEAR